MPLSDYAVLRDKFELPEHECVRPGFAFPCSCCKHNQKHQDDEPCRFCDHNANAWVDTPNVKGEGRHEPK